MDKLKQYLLEHRRQIDVEIPPTDLLPYIQAGAVAPSAKAVLIKYLIVVGILAVIGTGAWLLMHKQKPIQIPPPVEPPKEVIQKDTVPVQKGTAPAIPVQPVIKHKKIYKVTPAPPVIPKHKKKNVEPVHKPTPPRKKKRAVIPIT